MRTTGEVLVHIANGNREFLSAIKGATRDQMMALFKDQEKKEKNLTGKAAIIAEMKASWEEVTKALDAESEESLKKTGVHIRSEGYRTGSVDRQRGARGRTPRAVDRLRARQRHQAAVVGVTRPRRKTG